MRMLKADDWAVQHRRSNMVFCTGNSLTIEMAYLQLKAIIVSMSQTTKVPIRPSSCRS